MPPKAGNDEFSRDALFVFQCLMNAETKPKIDWFKVAQAMNLKNAHTASTRFYQITKKHGLDLKWNATPSTNANVTPVGTSNKRKRGKKNAGDDQDGDDEEVFVIKKKKENPDDDANALALADTKLDERDVNVTVKGENDDATNSFTPINGYDFAADEAVEPMDKEL